MDVVPTWLADVVNAAGICGVYCDDEWMRERGAPPADEPVVFVELPPMPH
jgi:hypothetical protein